jgi:fumarylacetoacetase
VGTLLHDHDAVRPLLVDRGSLTMELPVEIGDYVDGYAGLHHATNLGKILRPGTEPLNPNWRHLPVMYHGRTSTIVPSGSPIERPHGQVKVDDQVELRPTRQLDIELELGAVVGTGNRRGEPIGIDDAPAHIFGYVLVNDWSARDIQAFEYQPLGPFLGKSFATSISPWIVPAAALAPHLVSGLAARQDPTPLGYLRGDQRVPDLRFTIDLNDERISDVALPDALYWTAAQQLAHATVNGAATRPGDLIASGTLSGEDRLTQAGSLIERSWRTAFLADGDVVTIRGWAGEGDQRVGFGALTGQVVASGVDLQVDVIG